MCANGSTTYLPIPYIWHDFLRCASLMSMACNIAGICFQYLILKMAEYLSYISESFVSPSLYLWVFKFSLGKSLAQ